MIQEYIAVLGQRVDQINEQQLESEESETEDTSDEVSSQDDEEE